MLPSLAALNIFECNAHPDEEVIKPMRSPAALLGLVCVDFSAGAPASPGVEFAGSACEARIAGLFPGGASIEDCGVRASLSTFLSHIFGRGVLPNLPGP